MTKAPTAHSRPAVCEATDENTHELMQVPLDMDLGEHPMRRRPRVQTTSTHTEKENPAGREIYRRFMFLHKFLDTVYSERSRGGERGLPNRILIWKELD